MPPTTEHVQPLPPDATIELPFRLVLDWFMASDPCPLPAEQGLDLCGYVQRRARELGYDGWVDAYHEGGRVATGG